MKKSELRKVIKEVIQEQIGPEFVSPEIVPVGGPGSMGPYGDGIGGSPDNRHMVRCPIGYEFISNLSTYVEGGPSQNNRDFIMVDGCVRIKPDFDMKDPLGPGNVTSGGQFGTQNLGGLPSN